VGRFSAWGFKNTPKYLRHLSKKTPKSSKLPSSQLAPKKVPTYVLRGQGAAGEKNKNKPQCTSVLYLAWNFFLTYDFVIFFIAFLSPPHRETPKNENEKNRQGGKK
jgi:hypothetical protein